MTEARSEHHHSLDLHALAPLAWRVLIATVAILALYLVGGRFLMYQMANLRDPLLAAVNGRLPFAVSVDRLEGAWFSYSPELRLRELRLQQGDGRAPPLVIERADLRIDVAASLRSGSLQLSRLEIAGLALDARLTEDGVIEIEGFARGSGALQAWLQDFLPNVEHLALTDNRLRLATAGGSFDMQLNLSLERSGNARQLQGQATGKGLSLAVNAAGVGNPLRLLSWTGDVYIAARSEDLGAFSSLWSTLDWPFSLTGAADAEFWLNRADGDSRARMRWESEALQVDERSGAWSLPLDALSFEAALTQQARHWSLLTEDFHIERAGQSVDLDRAQFDWWGQGLRIRASDLGLDALPTLLAAAPGLPPGLLAALPELAPRGRLPAIELRLDDLAAPAASWQLRSIIEGLEVGSWRRTPALTGVSGYLDLGPGGGTLQVDSEGLSARFPGVYETPLFYDDVLGELRFAWDSSALHISSGLVELTGEEGRGRGLFAVDIPFAPRETGIELDLLIGLQDADLVYRDRYLPERLPGPLRAWLDASGMRGEVTRGGVIWRGSVMPGNQPHRTVQLFLDAADAELQYSPDWPALQGVDATLLLDDRRAWVRSARAEIDGARLTDTLLRVLPRSGGSVLDLATQVQGDAAAGGRLLAETPLRDLTAGVFADWQYTGNLDGALFLTLPLGRDAGKPRVEVDINLSGVDVQIAQLDLAAQGLEGVLHYSTATGFGGTTVSGRMLDGRVSASARDGIVSGVSLDIAGEVSAQAIAEWLKLPALEAAQGSASLAGELVVAGDRGAFLTLTSPLTGVTLDAPRPFGKTAEQPLPLELSLPLGTNPVIDVRLGERLHLNLALRAGELDRLVGAVGGAPAASVDCDQRYCLGGTLSALDIAEWVTFYDRYLRPRGARSAAEVTASALAFSYRVSSLQVGELRMATRSLGRARVDLWGVGSRWQGSLESPWVQGSLTQEGDGLRLLLEYLDIARFAGGEPQALADVRAILPSMRVDVLSLRHGDEELGALGFDLDMQHGDGALYATGIAGSLWDLRLDGPGTGLLRWSEEGGAEVTALELDTRFGDIGAVLEAAGFARTLESEAGNASLRLRWPGSPTAFAMRATQGAVRLEARNGRVLEARAGALSMISFLNLAEILRGLSLAHMFEAGIPFLAASSELYLHSGSVEVADMHIDGAASAFAFTGITDLNEGSVNGELLVTLPVANNLPWVAALAAGLPVAAGVFVVSKVFEKQVNRMSSAVYRVSGPIAEPQVEFRRLFDDKLKPNPVAPADNETGGG